ncbi:G-type lectin S-receptor-like serine/threonine-protein kinase [Forsythia ovata]|uniref:G-type lectin S-receptor-like serine/threonine-protein kinase n=1 Tax=Forsythia ovata TaxID=205694 RepID=A0ABD1S7A7_9LAMI
MDSNFMYNISYVENDDEVTITNVMKDPSIFSRMVLNESGILERLTWQGPERGWARFWYVPNDKCDNYAHCGAYSNCHLFNLSEFECSCLPGFEPQLERQWYLREGSHGCKRKQEENVCGNGQRFIKVTNAKVPDTSIAHVNKNLGLTACQELCLKNCSCTAFASANISGGGNGCITWHRNLVDIRQFSNNGQDLYIRVSAAELARNTRNSKVFHGKRLATTVITSIVGMLLILFLACWLSKKKRKVNTILSATDDFSQSNKLGEGGFGAVYKGRLDSGQEIAVKRLSKLSGQGNEEFKNEITLIARLQHKNLVRLLGCCVQQDEKIGYMSPEYAMQGLFSIKSDVYSFGVLLLEIICGRKNSSYIQDNTVNLIGHVWNLWREERALDIVDSSLDNSYDVNKILRCIHVVLLCVQECAPDRPIMSEVAFMLCNETRLPYPKQPAFIFNTASQLAPHTETQRRDREKSSQSVFSEIKRLSWEEIGDNCNSVNSSNASHNLLIMLVVEEEEKR